MNNKIASRLLFLTILCIALMHTASALGASNPGPAAGAASALDADDPKYWTDMGDESLRKGETYRMNNYTVTFTDYVPETDQVFLSLRRGDELLDESCLNASCTNESMTHRPELDRSVCDYLNWDDEVIIAIVNETDHPESETPTSWDDPLIHIKFYERAKPEISLEIETGCEVYTPRDSEIRVTVEIKNSGDAELKNVSVAIDSGDLHATGDLASHFSNLQAEVEGDYLFTWGDHHHDTIRSYLVGLGLGWVDKDADISESDDGDTITVKKGDDKSVTIEISGDTVTMKGEDLPDNIPDMEVKGEGDERKIYASSKNKDESGKLVYARLTVPTGIDDTEGASFTITTNVTGFDEKGVMYTESASTEILVLPRFDLAVRKTVNSHISMDDTVWVRIEVENTGIRDMQVRLNDTIPPGFRLCGNETPGWVFNITPSGSSQFSYHLKPEKPGIFEVPGATAEFVMNEKNISVRSNAPEITVDGVCIVINKTAHPEQIREGETVTVTLSVRNTGNTGATIELTDVLPPGAELVSGDPTIRAVLAANQTNETEYVMRVATPGRIILGTPYMSLSGSGYCYTTPTKVPVIEVTGSTDADQSMATPTPTEPILEVNTSPRSVDVPFYETVLVVCMFAGVFLIGRFMK